MISLLRIELHSGELWGPFTSWFLVLSFYFIVVLFPFKIFKPMMLHHMSTSDTALLHLVVFIQVWYTFKLCCHTYICHLHLAYGTFFFTLKLQIYNHQCHGSQEFFNSCPFSLVKLQIPYLKLWTHTWQFGILILF